MNLLPTISPNEQQEARAIQELLKNTPLNDYGFPVGIYRPDLLPFHDYLPESAAVDTLLSSSRKDGGSQLSSLSSLSSLPSPTNEEDTDDDTDADEETEEEEETQTEEHDPLNHAPRILPGATQVPAYRIAGFRKDHLRAAFLPLDVSEGYPTLPDGRACWDKLPCESIEEFQCFQIYLELPLVCSGSRVLGELSRVMETNELLHVNGFTHEAFTEKFSMMQKRHYWSIRARAYDLYKTASWRKQQDLRALQVQETHYEKSTALLDRLMDYMGDEDLFWDQMTPKVAVDTLKTLTSIQRVSAGLPATNPIATKDGATPGQSLEVILKTLSQQGAQQTQETAIDGNRDTTLISRVLGDKATTSIAQELIIRLTTGQQAQARSEE